MNAIDAHEAHVMKPGKKDETGQWLFTACFTAAHEVLHLLGIEHYTQHACVMAPGPNKDGPAFSDTNPPYMCPIELQKFE